VLIISETNSLPLGDAGGDPASAAESPLPPLSSPAAAGEARREPVRASRTAAVGLLRLPALAPGRRTDGLTRGDPADDDGRDGAGSHIRCALGRIWPPPCRIYGKQAWSCDGPGWLHRSTGGYRGCSVL
jgi:hypothetical protein